MVRASCLSTRCPTARSCKSTPRSQVPPQLQVAHLRAGHVDDATEKTARHREGTLVTDSSVDAPSRFSRTPLRFVERPVVRRRLIRRANRHGGSGSAFGRICGFTTLTWNGRRLLPLHRCGRAVLFSRRARARERRIRCRDRPAVAARLRINRHDGTILTPRMRTARIEAQGSYRTNRCDPATVER